MRRNIFFLLFCFVLLNLTISAYSRISSRGEIDVKCGDISFKYKGDNNINLSAWGIPIIESSEFIVTKPSWGDYHYSPGDFADLIDKAKTEDFKGGKKIIIYHTLPPEKNNPFSGTETFIILPNNTITMTLDFTLKGEAKGGIEWCPAGINTTPFLGQPLIISKSGEIIKKEFPLLPDDSSSEKRKLAEDFDSVMLESKIGPIEITASQKTKDIFLDFRRNKWAMGGKPKLWLCLNLKDIEAGRKYSYTFTIKFLTNLMPNDYSDVVKTNALTFSMSDSIQLPYTNTNYLIPSPKKFSLKDQLFPLNSTTKIYLGKNPNEKIDKAINYFLRELKELYQIEPKVLKDDYFGEKEPKNCIIIGEHKRYKYPAVYLAHRNLSIPKNNEGYALLSDNNVICLSSESEEGIFYGLTTLFQLITIDEKGIFIKGAEITDFPAMKFRGIHCLSGKNAGDEIAKAISLLMARFKMNYLVWECEYIIWDSAPEIAHPDYGMTKKEAQKVIDAAKNNFMEIIPLVQSLGHSEWIFVNNKNLDIAEDPDKPYAYNPTNPDTYKFIFKIYQEAVDFFKPKIFHIGHDEVTMRGRFPYRSLSSGKTLTELIMFDINKLNDWFSKKGIRLMLWGDMFLYETEGSSACLAPTLDDAKTRRKLLPKNAIIADWHYEPQKPEDYKSLKLFKDEGFEVVGSGWFNLENIRNLANACNINNILGYMQTTWAGFNFKIDDHEKEWLQYWAYIWAGDYAWTGENTPKEQLPYNARKLFFDLWFERKPILKKKEGYLIDISSICNRKLNDDLKKSGWVGYGSELDLSSLPIERSRFYGTEYLVKNNEKNEAALMLSGKFNPSGRFPTEVQIDISNTHSTEIHLLTTATYKITDYSEIGKIIITYEDDLFDTMYLIYGKNIFAFNDFRMSKDCWIAWEGKAKNGEDIAVWDTVWKNPFPYKKIKQIKLSSSNTITAPVILAITCVN